MCQFSFYQWTHSKFTAGGVDRFVCMNPQVVGWMIWMFGLEGRGEGGAKNDTQRFTLKMTSFFLFFFSPRAGRVLESEGEMMWLRVKERILLYPCFFSLPLCFMGLGVLEGQCREEAFWVPSVWCVNQHRTKEKLRQQTNIINSARQMSYV